MIHYEIMYIRQQANGQWYVGGIEENFSMLNDCLAAVVKRYKLTIHSHQYHPPMFFSQEGAYSFLISWTE